MSTTSIRVESDDGFSKTYTVTDKSLVTASRDGIGAVKVGDRVAIRGPPIRNGADRTAIVAETHRSYLFDSVTQVNRPTTAFKIEYADHTGEIFETWAKATPALRAT